MRLEEAAELLEVSVDADETQIKASFRRLALLYHPDRCQVRKESSCHNTPV
jgi:curved DNA-binding protein CbpA